MLLLLPVLHTYVRSMSAIRTTHQIGGVITSFILIEPGFLTHDIPHLILVGVN